MLKRKSALALGIIGLVSILGACGSSKEAANSLKGNPGKDPATSSTTNLSKDLAAVIEGFDGPVTVSCLSSSGATVGEDGHASLGGFQSENASEVRFVGLNTKSGALNVLGKYTVPSDDGQGHVVSVSYCGFGVVGGPPGHMEKNNQPYGAFMDTTLRIVAVRIEGFAGGESHAGTVDLRTGKVTDLTELRSTGEKTFSTKISETFPRLVGDNRLLVDSTLLGSEGNLHRELEIDINNPTKVLMLAAFGSTQAMVAVEPNNDRGERIGNGVLVAGIDEIQAAAPDDFRGSGGIVGGGKLVPSGFVLNPSRSLAFGRCAEGFCAMPIRVEAVSAPTASGDWRTWAQTILANSGGQAGSYLGTSKPYKTSAWNWGVRYSESEAKYHTFGTQDDNGAEWPNLRNTNCSIEFNPVQPLSPVVVGWLDDKRVVILVKDSKNIQVGTVDVESGSLECGDQLVPSSTRLNSGFVVDTKYQKILFISELGGNSDRRIFSVQPGNEPVELGPAPSPVDWVAFVRGARVK